MSMHFRYAFRFVALYAGSELLSTRDIMDFRTTEAGGCSSSQGLRCPGLKGRLRAEVSEDGTKVLGIVLFQAIL